MFPYSISCSEGCIYKGIDNDNYSTCGCENNTSNSLESDFGINFVDDLTNSNFMLFSCYHKAFDTKRLFNNIGFYFLTGLNAITIAFLIFIVCILDKNYIRKNLKEIIRMDALYYYLNIYEKYNENDLNLIKLIIAVMYLL